MSNSAPNSRPQSSRGDARLGEEHVPPLKTVTRASAPYRPGFQPKGVYRPLTDDFLALRRQKQDGDGMKRVERTKLERRLEKLIALHFPMPPTVHEKVSKSHRPTGGHERRASSFFEFDLKNIHIVDAGNLWKNVVHAVEGNGKVDIRAEEQRITPWDDDSTTSKCPLCVQVHSLPASFHPLTNRKHHCRLCGKIVCSLPIKRPQRPVPCSTLFVVDPKTKKIEEVGEGVDYGVRRKRPSTGANGIVRMEEDEDRFLKGVRICKECRPVLLRQQYLQETLLVPPFVRLYEIFLLLEKDIESTLPQYQEFVLNLSQDIQPTKEALIIRKRLLESFAQYDTLSKQIRSLQCPRGPGSSPDRVQAAILTRASLFLQKNMLPLQSLPAPSRGGIKPSNGETPKVGPSPDIAHILQPLLEQEALLEGFVEEASAQRKFEDVKSLKANLAEIRAEIEKIVAAEEAGLNNRPRQSEINV
ncbi:hypothetical protein BDN72DRAFT_756093 [Pluteus cervinus]|uniref:Uncharacterized protein n=1 Tax=Pluteus cervinus TaxID=181527 RepID=A0ACD3BEN6_9AGAR|nr:hypothetical protein BDN72DRAFT_756093 [Pluteus cervinus]